MARRLSIAAYPSATWSSGKVVSSTAPGLISCVRIDLVREDEVDHVRQEASEGCPPPWR